MKKAALSVLAVVTVLAGGYAALKIKPYWANEIEAWVVDSETGEPIEGVHVVAHWALEFGLMGGGSTDLVLREAVTDKNGRFHFPAWGPKFVPQRLPMEARLDNFDPEIIMFKSGYLWHTVYDDRNRPPYAGRGPMVRSSIWHGKRIPLKKNDMPLDQYASFTGGVLTGVSWGRCGWAKIPRMMLALNAEAERLSAQKMHHSIPIILELESTAEGEECEPVREILSRYQK